MTGYRASTGQCYYVRGSLPYRRGLGCGSGVHVPQRAIEKEVLADLGELLGVCSDPKGFTRRVNEELRRFWEPEGGQYPCAGRKIEAIDAKVTNVRRAVEDGLSDAAWANDRLKALQAEQATVEAALAVSGEPPQIDVEMAMAYRQDAQRTLSQGSMPERKQILRTCLESMKLAPERLEVEVAYRLPGLFTEEVVAGEVYACIHRQLARWLVRRWTLPRHGRRPVARESRPGEEGH